MTWTPLDDVAEALTRLSQSINAAFRGRLTSSPAPSFIGTAQFISVTSALTVDFTDTSDGGGATITAWLWDFGDGGSSTLQNPSHTYAAEGTYLIGLTVTAGGVQVQAFEAVTVTQTDLGNADPVANFTTAINGRTVTFTDTSTDADGTVVDWVWAFGEGLPTASFSSIVTGLSVAFTDASSDVAPGTIVARSWDFGDGQTSTATNPTHIYAAAGGYNVTLTVTDNENNQAEFTATVSVTLGATLGIPFGPINFWSTSFAAPNSSVGSFTASQNAMSPSGIITEINAAAALGHKLILMPTSGNHSNYLTNGVFDVNRWKAKMLTYNTQPVITSVANAVTSGTVLGMDILDEPQSASWGPAGNITKATIDSMVDYTKAIFPTVPVGLSVKPDYLPTTRYTKVDFITTQYIASYGDVTTWKNKAIEDAAPDKVAIVFSMNIVNGGAGFNVAPGGCLAPTGGAGQDSGRCSMGSTQAKTFGLVLGPAGSALMMYQYDTAFMANVSNYSSFISIAGALAVLPRKTFRRTT